MGGFGSVSNMILHDMPAPPRLSTMEPSRRSTVGARRPGSATPAPTRAKERGNVGETRVSVPTPGTGAKSPRALRRRAEPARERTRRRGQAERRARRGAPSRGKPRRTSVAPRRARASAGGGDSGRSRAGPANRGRPPGGRAGPPGDGRATSSETTNQYVRILFTALLFSTYCRHVNHHILRTGDGQLGLGLLLGPHARFRFSEHQQAVAQHLPNTTCLSSSTPWRRR